MTPNRARRIATVLQWALLPMFALAILLPNITWSAPEGSFAHATPIDRAMMDQVEDNNHWTDQDAIDFPTCHPDREGLTDTVLVATRDGRHRTMSFDRAWGSGLWTIGFC